MGPPGPFPAPSPALPRRNRGLPGRLFPIRTAALRRARHARLRRLRERPVEGKGGSGVWAKMPESRPSAPEAGRPGSKGAGSGIIPPMYLRAGLAYPTPMRRPGTCRPDVPGLPERWRPPRPAPSTGRSHAPAAARTTAPSAAPRRARANSGIAASRGPCRPRAAWGYDGPRITSRHGFDFGLHGFDLPSATAPRTFCPNARGSAWAQRVHGGIRPRPPFLGHGHPDGGHRAQPADGHDRAQATASHAASGYWAASWASRRKRNSITAVSISMRLHAGKRPRRAACPGRCPHGSTSGPARCAETNFKQRLKDHETGMGIHTADHGIPARVWADVGTPRRPCCAWGNGRRTSAKTACLPDRGPSSRCSGSASIFPCPRRTRTCSGIRPGK